jgi:hypothetical protein
VQDGPTNGEQGVSMKSRQAYPRSQKVSVLVALFAVIGVGAGLTSSSDAQLPLNNYGGGTGPLPVPKPAHGRHRLTVPTKGATKSVRLSKSNTFTFAVGPFSENVSGTVSFVSSKAVASKKAKVSFGKKSFRARTGTKARIKVKLGSRARRAVKKNRTVRVIANIHVKDSSGNRSSKSLRFTLKRAK